MIPRYENTLAYMKATGKIPYEETVLGKSPETIIHNTNAQQNVEHRKIREVG